jgi:hypothetical protein
MTKNAPHTHSMIGQDDHGYYLSFTCPECEAVGVVLSDEDLRKGLLKAEKFFRRQGHQLTDLVAPESLPEVRRLLGRTKN